MSQRYAQAACPGTVPGVSSPSPFTLGGLRLGGLPRPLPQSAEPDHRLIGCRTPSIPIAPLFPGGLLRSLAVSRIEKTSRSTPQPGAAIDGWQGDRLASGLLADCCIVHHSALKATVHRWHFNVLGRAAFRPMDPTKGDRSLHRTNVATDLQAWQSKGKTPPGKALKPQTLRR